LDVVRQIRAALPANGSREAKGFRAVSDTSASAAIRSGPRSSNLRLRKTFNDADRDRFLEEAFEFMTRFFENSLAELKARNQNVEGRFRRLDGSRFTAVIYKSGVIQTQCTISLGGPSERGISYSNSGGGTGNSFNEMLSIEHDEQHLYLKPTGMWMMGAGRDAELGFEGAAEYYWSILIEPLQR
jgi:hypothetical protein